MLYNALELLEMLITLYVKYCMSDDYQDGVLIPEKIRRYLSVFKVVGSDGNITNPTTTSNNQY